MQMLTFHNVDKMPAEQVTDAFLLLIRSFLSIRCICQIDLSRVDSMPMRLMFCLMWSWGNWSDLCWTFCLCPWGLLTHHLGTLLQWRLSLWPREVQQQLMHLIRWQSEWRGRKEDSLAPCQLKSCAQHPVLLNRTLIKVICIHSSRKPYRHSYMSGKIGWLFH